ncbi:MAG: LysR family transcriptional regulator, partial [Sphingobium sp.]
GSFSRAAESLKLTQSALTHSIKALEKSMGLGLLERSASGATATRAGMSLYEHAKLLLNDSDRIRTEVNRAAAGLAGTIKLAVHPIFSDSCLPQALSVFAEKYDRLSIHVQEGDVEDTVPLLSSGEIDLVISTVPLAPIHTNLSYERLGSVRWDFYAGSDHALAGSKAIAASELCRQRWVLLDRRHEMDFVARYFAEHDEGMLEDTVQTGSFAVMRSMILGCGMIGLMPVSYMAGTSAVPLKTATPPLMRPFGLIARADSETSRTMKEFIDIFRKCIAQDSTGYFRN